MLRVTKYVILLAAWGAICLLGCGKEPTGTDGKGRIVIDILWGEEHQGRSGPPPEVVKVRLTIEPGPIVQTFDPNLVRIEVSGVSPGTYSAMIKGIDDQNMAIYGGSAHGIEVVAAKSRLVLVTMITETDTTDVKPDTTGVDTSKAVEPDTVVVDTTQVAEPDTVGFPALWGTWKSNQFQYGWSYYIFYMGLRPDGSACVQLEVLGTYPADKYGPPDFQNDRIYGTGTYVVQKNTLLLFSTTTLGGPWDMEVLLDPLISGENRIVKGSRGFDVDEKVEWQRVDGDLCSSLGEPWPGPKPPSLEEVIAALDIDSTAFRDVDIMTLLRLWDVTFYDAQQFYYTMDVHTYTEGPTPIWYEYSTTYLSNVVGFREDGWFYYGYLTEVEVKRWNAKAAKAESVQDSLVAPGSEFITDGPISGRGRYAVHGDTLIFIDLLPRLVRISGEGRFAYNKKFHYVYFSERVRFWRINQDYAYYVFEDIATGKGLDLGKTRCGSLAQRGVWVDLW